MPVKPEFVKKLGIKIIEEYEDSITNDFTSNKELVDEVTNIKSKTVRNRVAGYITNKSSERGVTPEESLKMLPTKEEFEKEFEEIEK